MMRGKARLRTKEGIIQFLSSSLNDGAYMVWEYKDAIVIRSLKISKEGELGMDLDEMDIDYLIYRGATL